MSFIAPSSIVTDPVQLHDDAIDAINTTLEANGFPGWSPSDATLAVILLGTVARMLANVGNVAAVMVPAIWRVFGTQFLQIAYQNGAQASVSSTWTFTGPAPDSTSFLIEAGTTVIIDGAAFYVQSDHTAAMGDTSAAITLVASQAGTAYDDLGGVGVGAPRVEPNQFIDWVASVTTAGVTAGGADQETDDDYDVKLVGEVALQAPRPVTAEDYAPFVASDLALAATGVAVGRATAIDGYYPVARTLSTGGTGPLALTCSATIANTSQTVALVTGPYLGAIPDVGAAVTGAGIPANTTVLASPAPTASSFKLSHAATASATETLTIASWTSVGNAVTVFVTDVDGNQLIDASMDALGAWLENYRPGNWLVNVEPPTYSTVYVTTLVKVLPGFDPTSVGLSVKAALTAWLSPATWGNPLAISTGSKQWLNSSDGFNLVRYKKAIEVAGSPPGVDYVDTLALDFTSSPSATADLTMPGPAPLPLSTALGVSTIIVTTE